MSLPVFLRFGDARFVSSSVVRCENYLWHIESFQGIPEIDEHEFLNRHLKKMPNMVAISLIVDRVRPENELFPKDSRRLLMLAISFCEV
jgi:hypothetical protein